MADKRKETRKDRRKATNNAGYSITEELEVEPVAQLLAGTSHAIIIIIINYYSLYIWLQVIFIEYIISF